MKLAVALIKMNVPSWDRHRLEIEFRDAVLNYQPSVERIKYNQSKHTDEYKEYLKRGWRAVGELTKIPNEAHVELRIT